jgi:hypothetical protein
MRSLQQNLSKIAKAAMILDLACAGVTDGQTGSDATNARISLSFYSCSCDPTDPTQDPAKIGLEVDLPETNPREPARL